MFDSSDPSAGGDNCHSVDIEDELNVLGRIDFIIASLEKAGVLPDELKHFKRMARQTALAGAPAAKYDTSDKASRSQTVVAEGTLEILQSGEHCFAVVWRSRWVKLSPGRMQVFVSNSRPQQGTPCQFILPLSTEQTRLDSGSEAMCKKLDRETILMVSSRTSARGTLRCVTLAPKDDLAQEMWKDFLHKSMSSKVDPAPGASIYRACQMGDILRVKEILLEGFPPNEPNAYGCVALHYAVKNVALCAEVLARGVHDEDDEAKKRAQEALRIVVYLMSHGANARAVNHLGETPLDLASRLTNGLPKSHNLLKSILDSSKYDTAEDTVFIASSQPRLSSVEERYGEGYNSIAPVPTVTSRGVTLSPSKRDGKESKTQKIVNTWGPQTISSITSSFRGGANSTNVHPVRLRDDEIALDRDRHRLAAASGFHSQNSSEKQSGGFSRCVSFPGDRQVRVSIGAGARGDDRSASKVRRRRRGLGIMFDKLKMGKRSAVLGYDCKEHGKRVLNASSLRAHVRPRSPKDVRDNPRRHKASSCARLGHLVAPSSSSTTTGCSVGASSCRSNQWGERRGEGNRRRQAKVSWKGFEKRSPSIPDREARRLIAEWLRRRTCAAAPNPLAEGYRRGEYLIETSPYVATNCRSEVYNALQAIKGGGRGELIRSGKLRVTLSTVGQTLSPSEIDELFREADPGQTGYLSCARLSDLVTSCRLKPLAKGTTYNEDDDVVLQTKAKRKDRTKRLVERTPTIAQDS